jgi:prepilin-type N-terminal cleavage/methylation domain-containing protein
VSEATPTQNRRGHRSDGGFTLVELLIVISLVGLVATVLSSAVIVILRTAPSTELRIDDARSTRGLATWLSHDVASTPPFEPPVPGQGGFSRVSTANSCDAPAGVTLVELTWVQSNRTFVATYRADTLVSGETVIRRYACSTPPRSATRRANLTSGLAPLNPANPNIVNLLKDSRGRVTVVEFRLTGRSGERVVLDVSSRNPSEKLS